MRHSEVVILIDADFRRRAAVSHLLADTDIHVEPFEDVTELAQRWPRDGVVLAHDKGGTVRHLIDQMSEDANWLPLIAFAEEPGTTRVVQAVLHGAVDYLEWPFGETEVRTALAIAEESRDAWGNVRLREAMARSRIRRLTPREREVLAGVADGLSNRLIGERLSISPRTVEIHRANMLNKMGANHTSEAIRIAIEGSLVS
ncbi:MAG: LuxR family transcriptional regulator [Proteobacteria bacterium]|nr:LuxR family transcriptional regulator [Pseudomonadota bacterium]